MNDSTTKRCPRCCETKPLSDFALDKHSKDGHQARCKACNCAWHREFYKKHYAKGPRPRIRKLEPHESKTCNRCGATKPVAEFRGHKRTDGDGYYNQCRECERAANRAAIPRYRERRRAWDIANREHVYAMQKAWRERNPDKYEAQRRKYWASEKGKLYARMKTQQRRVRKAPDAPVTLEQVQALMARQKHCYYCRKPFTAERKATLDHVIPLAKGGAHDISNLVLACRPCNAGKRDRLTRLL